MKPLTIAGLVLGVVLSLGVAVAATTEWGEYRVDLIRCADAGTVCGSVVTGTDPLSSGRITVKEDSVAIRIRGAKPDTLYRVSFLQMKNNGTNVSGPYGIASSTNVGELTTDHKGNGSKTFTTKASIEPRLGFFYVGHPGQTNEFVTGIDQN
ncbi:MAG: hypothetical protein AAB701_00645 [Patescibacteria group bacterium]